MLAMALEDHSSEGGWWIDAGTGEIWYWRDFEDDDREFDPAERADARRIDPLPSREGFGDMEDFIARVPPIGGPPICSTRHRRTGRLPPLQGRALRVPRTARGVVPVLRRSHAAPCHRLPRRRGACGRGGNRAAPWRSRTILRSERVPESPTPVTWRRPSRPPTRALWRAARRRRALRLAGSRRCPP